MKLTATSAASPQPGLRAMVPVAESVDASQVQFMIGIMGNQGGTLVTGYSGTANTTDSYEVTTTLNDGLNNGITLGYGGYSQTFSASDPSYLPLPNQTITGSGTVPASAGANGLFMATFSTTGTTTLDLSAQSHSLAQVDEVVLRLNGGTTQPLTNGATLVICPHVIYNGTLYSDANRTLTVNGSFNQFWPMQYILFAPASRIGLNVSCFVGGDHTVIDPVTNDTDGTQSQDGGLNMTPASTWTAKDPVAWINDPGCAGLLAAINTLAGTSDQTNPTWKAMVSYWEGYFIKYYAADSTMFNNNDGPNGEGWLGGGNGAPAAFEIISLVDSDGPLKTDGQSSLNLAWDASSTQYTLGSGVMDLAGQPPIMFSAGVAN